MNFKQIILIPIILIISCIEPTLIDELDCTGKIGGQAVVDECGICDGPGLTGCDSRCGSILQIDCDGECGGTAVVDCNDECNGGAHLDYYCKENEDSTPNLDSLSTECFSENEFGNCGPNTPSCLYVDCESDSMYQNTVIDCNFNLPSIENGLCNDEGVCINLNDPEYGYVGDGSCDYYGAELNYTNCVEFNFDEGDCNLIDCNDFHFSEEVCISLFDYSCAEGDNPWLGDGFCDEGEDETLPLNFNCVDWGFDGAECICHDAENNEYDCWDKTISGHYTCGGEIRGGDCLDSYGRVKYTKGLSKKIISR